LLLDTLTPHPLPGASASPTNFPLGTDDNDTMELSKEQKQTRYAFVRLPLVKHAILLAVCEKQC
jgi:hypothetical protein